MTYYTNNKGYSVFKVITCIRNTFAYVFLQDVRPSLLFLDDPRLVKQHVPLSRPIRPVLLLDDPWVVKAYILISTSISLYAIGLTTTGFPHSYYHSSFFNLTR